MITLDPFSKPTIVFEECGGHPREGSSLEVHLDTAMPYFVCHYFPAFEMDLDLPFPCTPLTAYEIQKIRQYLHHQPHLKERNDQVMDGGFYTLTLNRNGKTDVYEWNDSWWVDPKTVALLHGLKMMACL
jgi:hypothetical protein